MVWTTAELSLTTIAALLTDWLSEGYSRMVASILLVAPQPERSYQEQLGSGGKDVSRHGVSREGERIMTVIS